MRSVLLLSLSAFASTWHLRHMSCFMICSPLGERVWFRCRQPWKLAPLLGAEPLLRRIQEDRRPRRRLRSPDHWAAGQSWQNHSLSWKITSKPSCIYLKFSVRGLVQQTDTIQAAYIMFFAFTCLHKFSFSAEVKPNGYRRRDKVITVGTQHFPPFTFPSY